MAARTPKFKNTQDKKHRKLTMTLAATFAAAGGAFAQVGYPEKPIRLIVPFAPAGITDVLARILAQKLAESFGQQVVVDNRAGAGGNIGMGIAARAPADGYTLIIVTSSFVVNPALYAKIPYDPLKDFAPVTFAASTPNMLVVHPGVAAKSVQELVALVKAQPRKFNFASPGTGTTPHLTGELFRMSLAPDLAHIPYNGAGPAVAAVISGQVPVGFFSMPPVQPHVKAGTLRGLAVMSAKRSPALPDVMTMAEAGYSGYESDTLQGVLVPAGTPQAIINRLHREITRIIASVETRERLSALGFEPVGNTQQEFSVQIRSELARWAKVVQAAGIRAE